MKKVIKVRTDQNGTYKLHLNEDAKYNVTNERGIDIGVLDPEDWYDWNETDEEIMASIVEDALEDGTLVEYNQYLDYAERDDI